MARGLSIVVSATQTSIFLICSWLPLWPVVAHVDYLLKRDLPTADRSRMVEPLTYLKAVTPELLAARDGKSVDLESLMPVCYATRGT